MGWKVDMTAVTIAPFILKPTASDGGETNLKSWSVWSATDNTAPPPGGGSQSYPPKPKLKSLTSSLRDRQTFLITF